MIAEIAALALCLFNCEAREEALTQKLNGLDYGERLERIEPLGHYSLVEAALLLGVAGGGAPVATETGFALYRVTYRTAGVHGGTTSVSGLVGVPLSRDIKGVVSWHHGTATLRANSISTPSVPEGLAVAALFAGDGYLTVAPDYIGLGVSTETQAYYHWPSTVGTVVDLLAIAEIMLDGIAAGADKDLYLAGFSQGGAATAATQRSLEQQNPTGLRLRGAASIAGAFNPREISLPHFMENGDPFFIAMTMSSFAHVYGESLEGVVREPYKSTLPGLFDGTHSDTEIRAGLPQHVSALVTDSFMGAYAMNRPSPQWFYDGLGAARTDDYAPVAPMRLYFGTQDNVVVPEEAHSAYAAFSSHGGNVTETEVGPFSHDEMVLNSLPLIQQWFDSIDAGHP